MLHLVEKGIPRFRISTWALRLMGTPHSFRRPPGHPKEPDPVLASGERGLPSVELGSITIFAGALAPVANSGGGAGYSFWRNDSSRRG
jgi:hypothetical protein